MGRPGTVVLVAPVPASALPLLLDLAGPAIAVRPEWALRADLSVRIVNSLFMRAAYDSIRHDDGFDSVILKEPEDAGSNGRICPNIAVLGEQALHYRLGALRDNNSNRDFAGAFVVGTVERDGGGREATKAAAGLLLQR